MTINKKLISAFIAEAKSADIGFDLHGFDTRLAEAFEFETPNDYAQRKAEAEGLAMPVSPLDDYSVGRKLVSMLGSGWTWTVADSGTSSLASVLGTEVGFIENHQIGPVALRIAALDALAAQ